MYLYNRVRNIDNISSIRFKREVNCSNAGGCIDFVLYILPLFDSCGVECVQILGVVLTSCSIFSHGSGMLCVSSHAEPAHV